MPLKIGVDILLKFKNKPLNKRRVTSNIKSNQSYDNIAMQNVDN